MLIDVIRAEEEVLADVIRAEEEVPADVIRAVKVLADGIRVVKGGLRV